MEEDVEALPVPINQPPLMVVPIQNPPDSGTPVLDDNSAEMEWEDDVANGPIAGRTRAARRPKQGKSSFFTHF